MKAIFKRELRAYFTSPIGYVYLSLFLASNGILFALTTILQGSASSIQSYFFLSMYSLIFIMPILTMKVFAEEKKARTEQLLLTAPVSLFSVFFGKFLASFCVYAIGIGISCFNYIVIFSYGSASIAVVICSVLLELLIGGVCISIGLFISSLTENQFVACIVTMASLIALMALSFIEGSVKSSFLRAILSWICIADRSVKFFTGRLDIPSIFYYLSLVFIFGFLTVRGLERRRWN